MTERQEFGRPTGLQIVVTLVIFALACLLEGASDWINSLSPPSLTIGAISVDAVAYLCAGLLIGVPVALLVWNKLVAPIFSVPKLRYVHALVLVTAIYWIKGL